MKTRYRLIKRGCKYYAHDRFTGQRSSLYTQDLNEAGQLLAAKNQSAYQPQLSRALAQAHLSVTDPELNLRTWQDVMDIFATRGRVSSQSRSRRAFQSRHFKTLRPLPLIKTTAEHFMAILKNSGPGTHNYLRRLHSLALKHGWLLRPILPTAGWPILEPAARRAITVEKHQRILATETNQEQKLFYALLWETGATQSDAAHLCREDIDEAHQILIYFRQKTRERCQLTIGSFLRAILDQLPQSGALFPRLREISANHRASEFRRRCKILKITGVSLHCYRYSWAERACAAGYPERFAQAALGHKSKAVHRGYARKAYVVCPSLESFEKAFPSGPIPAVNRIQNL